MSKRWSQVLDTFPLNVVHHDDGEVVLVELVLVELVLKNCNFYIKRTFVSLKIRVVNIKFDMQKLVKKKIKSFRIFFVRMTLIPLPNEKQSNNRDK